jgi:hypothetical protein
VSTKEQADKNQSLEIQKKYCLQTRLKNDLNTLLFFAVLMKVLKQMKGTSLID